MRKTYRVLASLIAVLVVVQATLIVWAVAGLFNWIDEGETLDKSVVKGWEDEPPTFDGAIGHFLHAFVIGGGGGPLPTGVGLIPLTGLLLLIVSFFANIPRGVALAVAVVVSIIVQILAGHFAEPEMPYLGLLHGLNAFILFGLAVAAARAARNADTTQPATAPAV
jgi:hypothetical protein